MIQYKDFDLKKIMDAENLDFARWTYSRGQCSCCYGPLDMPARFWKDGKKPKRHFLSEDKRTWDYELNGKKFNTDEMRYILFKNAENGSGTVNADDFVKDYVCVEYNLDFPDQVRRVCGMLQDQLDDDYIVEMPRNEMHCIVIRLKEKLEEVNG